MTAQPATLPKPQLQDAVARISALRDELNAAFVERDGEVGALITALVAEAHVLLFGPPGTGKSALINAITGAIGGTKFSVLLTKFSTPEEVFGPISLAGLEQDQYRRVTAGYLPEARVAFVDEIFKANSAILNSLLTIANERQFDDGGQRRLVPLEIMIGASNELPEDESLAALYDRFLFRRWTVEVSDRDKLRGLLMTAGAPTVTTRLADGDLAILRAARDRVEVAGVVDKILDLRDRLEQEHSVQVSTRRLRQCMTAVRAAAVIAGRDRAVASDLMVLADCLWDDPETRSAVAATVAKIANPDLGKAQRAYNAAVRAFKTIDLSKPASLSLDAASEVRGKLDAAIAEIDALSQSDAIDAIREKICAMHLRVSQALSQSLGLGF